MTDVPVNIEGGLLRARGAGARAGLAPTGIARRRLLRRRLGGGHGCGAAQGRRLGDDDPDSAVGSSRGRPSTASPSPARCGRRPRRPGDAGSPDACHRLGHPRPHQRPRRGAANEATLIDLDNGATSLWVELGAGLDVDDLPAPSQGVLLDLAPVILSGSSTVAAQASSPSPTTPGSTCPRHQLRCRPVRRRPRRDRDPGPRARRARRRRVRAGRARAGRE